MAKIGYFLSCEEFDAPELVPALRDTGRLQLAYAVLLAAGLLLA